MSETIYLLSSGCYSDYSVFNAVYGPPGADMVALGREYIGSLGFTADEWIERMEGRFKGVGKYKFTPMPSKVPDVDGFYDWLKARPEFREAPITELWCGGYYFKPPDGGYDE